MKKGTPKSQSIITKVIKYVVLLLIGAFVGAVCFYFIWPDLLNTIEVNLFGEPNIIVNINEINSLEDSQHLENFSLIFGTSNGLGTILAAQTGQPELNKTFGDIAIPIDFGENGNNLEYFINILNNGTGIAKDIKITFSGDTLKTDYKIDVDNRINFVSCGGSDCDIRKNELGVNDRVGLFVKARTPTITNVNISAKGIFTSFVNYRKFYVKNIVEGESIQLFLNETQIAKLPPLNQNSNFIQYYYAPKENKWIMQ
jgi:hypothetical protein